MKAAVIAVVWDLLRFFLGGGGCRWVSHSEIKVVSYSLKQTPYRAALGVARGAPLLPNSISTQGECAVNSVVTNTRYRSCILAALTMRHAVFTEVNQGHSRDMEVNMDATYVSVCVSLWKLLCSR